MRSELFRISYEWGGVPMFGFGVLLVLWLVGWAIGLTLFARRSDGKSSWGALAAEYGPIIALGAGMLIFLPRLFPDGLPIRGWGAMLLLAASTGLAMATHRARQNGLDPDAIYSLTFWMFLFGIAGARLFFVIEYWDIAFTGPTLVDRFRKVLMFTEGGMVVYGSLIGAVVAFVWRCRSQKLPTLAIADILAPSLAIGLAIGRLGCLLNGCCYGGLCEQPWAITFPQTHSPGSQQYSPAYGDQVGRGEMHGIRLAAKENPANGSSQVVIAEVRLEDPPAELKAGQPVQAINGAPTPTLDDARFQLYTAFAGSSPLRLQLSDSQTVTIPAAPIRARSLPVHPTQIYSAVNAALLGWFLWAIYPYRRRDGVIIGLLLSIYPVSRFLLEIIRTDETSFFGTGLSISQNVSVGILAAMAAFWLWLRRQPEGSAFDPALAPQ